MREFRIHGRGGQGSVVTAELIADSAFRNNFEAQAFPDLGGGGERRGAPVVAFARVSEKPVRKKCAVENPDYVIIQDVSLIGVVDLLEGIKKEGKILINTEEDVENLALDIEENIDTYTFPATKVALEVLEKPIMNTAMLGALCNISEEIDPNSMQNSVRNKFPGGIGEKNAEAVEEAFKRAQKLF